jgi:hypothetical protein
MFLKKSGSKRAISAEYNKKIFLPLPPPPPHPIANVSGKTFLGALFNFQKCPWKPVPPQSSDASYAPGNGNLTELLSYCISWNFS